MAIVLSRALSPVSHQSLFLCKPVMGAQRVIIPAAVSIRVFYMLQSETLAVWNSFRWINYFLHIILWCFMSSVISLLTEAKRNWFSFVTALGRQAGWLASELWHFISSNGRVATSPAQNGSQTAADSRMLFSQTEIVWTVSGVTPFHPKDVSLMTSHNLNFT